MLEAGNPGCVAHIKRTLSRRTPCWKPRQTDLKDSTKGNTMARRTISPVVCTVIERTLCIWWCNMVPVRIWGQHPAHNLWNSTCVTRGVTCGAVVNPCSGVHHDTQQDTQPCNLWWCKLLAISCVLSWCYPWCPPSNLFDSNKVSSSTRCA